MSVAAAAAPAVPSKDWASSLRHLSKEQRQGQNRSEWRNSLVAVDDETGTIIGVVAHGVVLEDVPGTVGGSGKINTDSDDDDDDDSHEACTPPVKLEYTAAHTYHDPDVRPPSRTASILGEDTFAPPPIPEKPLNLTGPMRSGVGKGNGAGNSSEDEEEESEEEKAELIDGMIKVHVHHAEKHRPELLRDRDAGSEVAAGHSQEASGSTLGGPAMQLWRKARGGKKGEAKRKAKKDAKSKAQSESQAQMMSPSATVARQDSGAVSLTEDVQTATEVSTSMPATVMVEAETNSSEMPGKKQSFWHLANKNSIMSHHLPGNSVLINFLAGSQISARLLQAASGVASSGSVTAPSDIPQVQTTPSTSTASTAAVADTSPTGLVGYMPVLPTHLLWYFQGSDGAQREDSDGSKADAAAAEVATHPVTYMGAGLATIASTVSVSPSLLSQAAIQGASSVWNGVTSATSWLGSSLLNALPERFREGGGEGEGEEELNVDSIEPGDADAQEVWEWTVPSFDASTLENTPRPVYRRRKLVPSPEGHYSGRQTAATDSVPASSSDPDPSRRYSIVHFDQWGIARRAYTKYESFGW